MASCAQSNTYTLYHGLQQSISFGLCLSLWTPLLPFSVMVLAKQAQFLFFKHSKLIPESIFHGVLLLDIIKADNSILSFTSKHTFFFYWKVSLTPYLKCVPCHSFVVLMLWPLSQFVFVLFMCKWIVKEGNREGTLWTLCWPSCM